MTDGRSHQQRCHFQLIRFPLCLLFRSVPPAAANSGRAAGDDNFSVVRFFTLASRNSLIWPRLQSCIETCLLSSENHSKKFPLTIPTLHYMAQYFSQLFPKPSRNVVTLLCTTIPEARTAASETDTRILPWPRRKICS